MEPSLNPRTTLRPYLGPGIFITGTGTDVGKTTVTAALAAAFHRLHLRVGICKPFATDCRLLPHANPATPLSDDDFESPDATFAAHAAGLDPTDKGLLRYLSPIRYQTPVAPAVAARLECRAPDWRRLETAFDWWQENAEVLLIEGAGGWYVPLDGHDYMIADLAAALRLPVLVVTHPNLGAINQTLLTIHAIKQRNLAIAGLVINRVPPDSGKRNLAVQTNLEELPRLSGVPVRAILPELPAHQMNDVPPHFVGLLDAFAREWWQLMAPA